MTDRRDDLDRLRMCIAEAGYDPDVVYVTSGGWPAIRVDFQPEDGPTTAPSVPTDIAKRALALVYPKADTAYIAGLDLNDEPCEDPRPVSLR